MEQSNSSGKMSKSTCSSRIHRSVAPERCGIVSVSPEALSHIWEEAEGLLSSPKLVCDAPDMVDAKYMASGSGDKPHTGA